MFTIILEHDELIIWTQDGKKIKILVFLTVVDKSHRWVTKNDIGRGDMWYSDQEECFEISDDLDIHERMWSAVQECGSIPGAGRVSTQKLR